MGYNLIQKKILVLISNTKVVTFLPKRIAKQMIKKKKSVSKTRLSKPFINPSLLLSWDKDDAGDLIGSKSIITLDFATKPGVPCVMHPHGYCRAYAGIAVDCDRFQVALEHL